MEINPCVITEKLKYIPLSLLINQSNDVLKKFCRLNQQKVSGNKLALFARMLVLIEVDKNELKSMLKDDLKDICDEFELRVTGNKDDLLDRVYEEIMKRKKINKQKEKDNKEDEAARKKKRKLVEENTNEKSRKCT